MGFHIHKYKIECNNTGGHSHKLLGYAGNMLGVSFLHFHVYYGVSSYNSHTHYFYGITSMPIKTENGHVHKMNGVLETNNFHFHIYDGYTFEEISYISSGDAVGLVR